MTEPRIFQSHPVEAMQYTGSTLSANQIIDWLLSRELWASYRCHGDDVALCTPGTEHTLLVRSDRPHARDMTVREGWWVVFEPSGRMLSIIDSEWFDKDWVERDKPVEHQSIPPIEVGDLKLDAEPRIININFTPQPERLSSIQDYVDAVVEDKINTLRNEGRLQ